MNSNEIKNDGKPDSELSPKPSDWEVVAASLRKLKFKRQIIGGVDEVDAWKKIEKLNSLYDEALRAKHSRYEAALKAERARYDALLRAERQRYDELLKRSGTKAAEAPATNTSTSDNAAPSGEPTERQVQSGDE